MSFTFVFVYWDFYSTSMFSVADRDHSQHDALAVILMSHGGLNEWNNREYEKNDEA